jgi:hypothetical protein
MVIDGCVIEFSFLPALVAEKLVVRQGLASQSAENGDRICLKTSDGLRDKDKKRGPKTVVSLRIQMPRFIPTVVTLSLL